MVMSFWEVMGMLLGTQGFWAVFLILGKVERCLAIALFKGLAFGRSQWPGCFCHL